MVMVTMVTVVGNCCHGDGQVIEVVNADSLVVKLADGTVKKIFLASIRSPRLGLLILTSDISVNIWFL